MPAFLYLLQQKHESSYGLIRSTIRQVAPFFDDFNLLPDPLNESTIRLAWKHTKSDQYFGASALSDGTLRFMAQRFIPLVMMHEFEAMLFSDCAKFAAGVGKPIEGQLQAILDQFGDPELINDSPTTAPSKRILSLAPHYQKPLYGNVIALEIGLDEIRNKCKHFGDWITVLESRTSKDPN